MSSWFNLKNLDSLLFVVRWTVQVSKPCSYHVLPFLPFFKNSSFPPLPQRETQRERERERERGGFLGHRPKNKVAKIRPPRPKLTKVLSQSRSLSLLEFSPSLCKFQSRWVCWVWVCNLWSRWGGAFVGWEAEGVCESSGAFVGWGTEGKVNLVFGFVLWNSSLRLDLSSTCTFFHFRLPPLKTRVLFLNSSF